MAEVQYEITNDFARLVAACLGVDLDGEATQADVMPYNPAVLEAIASSGHALAH